jgi:hypothetical protein
MLQYGMEMQDDRVLGCMQSLIYVGRVAVYDKQLCEVKQNSDESD